MGERGTRHRVLITMWGVQAGNPVLDQLEAAGCEVVLHPKASPHTESEMIELVPGIDAAIAGSDVYNAAVLAAADSLKVISRVGVGYDSIDVRAATSRRIAVCTTPGTNHDAVADHAFGLILALARQIPAHERFVREHRWRRLTGADVHGATLGILGLGRIGKAAARRGRGFDMRVIAYDPVWDDAFAAENQIECQPVETVLREADFVTLHLPAGPETHHFLNAERLALMKPTAYVVNTGRGSLIDEVALLDCLKANRIAGAGLDVYEQEPPWGSALLELENVVLTPHVAGLTVWAVAAMAKMATENALLVLRGERPLFAVNPEIFG